LAEPFLLLREIELHVRQILEKKLSEEDLLLIDALNPPGKKPTSISELTFGHYVRLFQHPLIWAKLNLKIDSGLLTAQLEEVRLKRNDVMHFDQEPMLLTTPRGLFRKFDDAHGARCSSWVGKGSTRR